MASRRGNNEGAYTKRADGRWEVRLSLPDGKRRSFYGKTRKEVERKAAEVRRAIEDALPVLSETYTLGQFLESWLEVKRHTVEPTSWKRYCNQLCLHVIPVLGNIALTRLTAHNIQRLYAQKLSEGLAANTVLLMHRILRVALQDAVKQELLHRNVANLATPPRSDERDMIVLDQDQARKFLHALTGERLAALFVLALTTGMREGELVALRWQDVDLENATIQVRGSLQIIQRQKRLAKPKTKASQRRIALSQTAVDALVLHRQSQLQEWEVLGLDAKITHGLVFTGRTGGYLSPTSLESKTLRRLLIKAGLPRMRFHDLRHTAATLLLSQGINIKVVSEMLGHASVAITLRVYAHVLPHMQLEAARAMDVILRS